MTDAYVGLMSGTSLDGISAAVARFRATKGTRLQPELLGFTVTFAPGSAYHSINYRWFAQRYSDFSYLDRVVVAPAYRRQGIGSLIYDAAEQRARQRGRMTLEVYAEPPNEASLAFHERRGYEEVGRLRQVNGKICAMLVKELV